MNAKLKKNPFFSKLFSNFDKEMMIFLERTNRTLVAAIDKVEKKLEHCESLVGQCVDAVRQQCDKELEVAEILVNRELKSKVIMSQWTNKFLAETDSETIDPITFAFARFSMNICLCYADIDQQYLIRSKVHDLLVALANFPSELVAGPSMMGLVHLSFLSSMKQAVIDVGVLPILLKLMVESNSKLILTQCCKLCASLALLPQNKTKIINSGSMHAVVDLILGANKATDNNIQYYALCSTLNLIYGNDANRVLSVELKTIKPIITTIQTTNVDLILCRAMQVMANISFCNSYTGSCILALGGDNAMIEALLTVDINKQVQTAYACLAAFTNICSNEANQSHIGSKETLIEIAVRICDQARDVTLVAEAATLLLSVVWNNIANKAKVAAKGACSTFLKRIIRHSEDKSVASQSCIERMSLTLSSLLLYPSNHEKINEIGGLEELVRICKHSSEPRILASLSMIISTMVPSPDELYRFHDEEFIAPVEKANSLPVLKKARLFGFGHLAQPPEWLDKAVSILGMTDEALKRQEPWKKEEYNEKSILFEEFTVDVFPDSSVMDSEDYRGLIFSVY